MKRENRLFVLILCLAAMLLVATSAFGGEAKTYKVVNNTGTTASDVHIIFSGTGGDVTTRVLYQPAACGVPTIPSQSPAVSGYSEIIWPAACIPDGDSIKIQVLTRNSQEFAGGYWTDPAHPTDPGIGPVESGDITEIAPMGVPALSTWGIVALVLILGSTAVYFLRRKRATA